MTGDIKELVSQYRSESLSIFPLPYKSKRDDSFKWGEFQKRLATDAEVARWFNGHQTNIAVVCGKISGNLVVVEFDDPANFTRFNQAFHNLTKCDITEVTRVTQGKRGPHVWLRTSQPVKSRKYPTCEIRSDGNYIVVPPSVHPDGPEYRFLSEMPIWEIDTLKEVGIDIEQAQQAGRNQPGWVSELLKGVGQGGRNEAAVKLAGYFHGRIARGVTETLLLDWNTRNSPPLPTSELLTTINSVFRYSRNNGEVGGDADSIRKDDTVLSVTERDTPVSHRVTPYQTVTSVSSVTSVSPDIIRAYMEDTDGQWVEYRDLDNDLGIRTPDQKTARRTIISRLKASKFIEGHETISTKIRRVKSALNEMVLDFEKEADYLPLIWPFGLHEKVDIYPKSLVVVAGTKDSGKTAFCLNTARKNCDLMPVHYFNSEMGDVEMMNRLRNFDDYRDWVSKIHWVERAAAFEDVIFPNDLNIIDFLEVTTEFYLVSAMLSAIYRKLDKGIAVVALQKNPGSQYGRGGAFSVEKARLYVTMNHAGGTNTAIIESGKMWHNVMDNPRGQYKTYKLAKGCYFVSESNWLQRQEKGQW